MLHLHSFCLIATKYDENLAKLLENKSLLLFKEMKNLNKAIKELYLDKVSGKVPEEVF